MRWFPPFSTAKGGGAADTGEHDFGPVLGRGQLLRHVFTFTNPTTRPIRLTGATPTTPCCSQIGPILQGPIPPGSQGSVPVTLKGVAEKKELRRVGFLVQTDSKDFPTLTYSLRATFYPEWEVQASADSSRTLPIRRAGRQVLRITCFRVADEGHASPTGVTVEPPLAVKFLGEPREQTESEGVTAIVRDVEVSLPSSSELGTHQGTLIFRWPDGRTRERIVLWSVVSPLSARPSKLIVKQSEGSLLHTIVMRSFDNQPFRVGAVEPPHLVLSSEFINGAANVHTLKLWIDPDRAAREKCPQITIRTDRSDQPSISLNVVVLPPGV
jgi:Protein of unknown function (DUF1573)